MGGLPTAKKFRDIVLAAYPTQMLTYNQSPSFNWDASGMTDEEMSTFIWDLGKIGYCWRDDVDPPEVVRRRVHGPHELGDQHQVVDGHHGRRRDGGSVRGEE